MKNVEDKMLHTVPFSPGVIATASESTSRTSPRRKTKVPKFAALKPEKFQGKKMIENFSIFLNFFIKNFINTNYV